MNFGGVAQLGEQLPCKQQVDGSIPSASTKLLIQEELVVTHQGVAQPGRVRALEARCRRFKSCRPDHYFLRLANGDLRYFFAFPASLLSPERLAFNMMAMACFFGQGISLSSAGHKHSVRG